MACQILLRSDLQALLDKYREIRDKFSALHVYSEMQQKSLEGEREKFQMMKNKAKNILCLLMKREGQYKASLDHLEKENERLQCILVAAQREHERDKLLNNDKVSKLQDEINFLRMQVIQLENNYKQQLMLQAKHHEDEISKYKRLLDNANANLLLQNAASKNVQGIRNGISNAGHPALIWSDESVERKKNRAGKLPALEVVKVVHKRRKLFHKDDETVVNII